MVFKPLADWKVWLLSIGMFEERYEQLLEGCLVVGWRSDWTTRPTWCHVLYQDWTSSIVTNWSCHCSTISHHHRTIWWWVMHPNCYWIGPSLSPGISQVSIILFTSHDSFLLCFIIFSLTLCHMPLSLLIIGLISFPQWHSPFDLADSFVLSTHFISFTISPIIHTLLDPFVLYCCSIYGSHVCGVLSQPHFLYLSCIG